MCKNGFNFFVFYFFIRMNQVDICINLEYEENKIIYTASLA